MIPILIIENSDIGDNPESDDLHKSRQELLDAALNLDVEANSEESVAATEQLEKLLDSAVLSELRKLSKATGRDVIGKSIRFFLKQTPEDVTELRQAISEKNLNKLGLIAHSLKSSSATLGATSLSKLCSRLEQSARTERIESATEQLLLIESLLPGVLLEL